MADSQTPNRLFTEIEVGASDNTWGTKNNANWARVDNILGDTTTVNTTGGNTALTDDEQDVAIVKTTGVLSSNAEIRFDTRRGTWIVYNGNTGAFTTKFIVAGQTGVNVPQGSYALVYGDGTDIIQVSLNADLLNDTTPQLGGDLDANGFDIWFDDATGIRDDSDNEQLIFQKTALAVNHWEMTNAAAGDEPLLQAVGGDTDVSARISSKGAGLIELAINGTNKLMLSGTVLYPATSDDIALGSTANMFADLFLASGAVVNFNNGGVTITHDGSADALDLAGGGFNFNDNLLVRPVIKDYGETVQVLGSGGGTRTVNMESGNVATLTVSTSANTLAITNPPASGTAGSVTLVITNGGSQTFNWPAGTIWPNGDPPTLTTSGIDVVTMFTINGGSTWYGFPAGIGMAT